MDGLLGDGDLCLLDGGRGLTLLVEVVESTTREAANHRFGSPSSHNGDFASDNGASVREPQWSSEGGGSIEDQGSEEESRDRENHRRSNVDLSVSFERQLGRRPAKRL